MSAKKVKFPLKLKSVIIIIALSAVLCAVSIVMSAVRFSDTNEKSFKDHSKDIANMAALTVDGDALKAVRDAVLEVYNKIPDDEIVLSDDWGSEEFEAFLAKFEFVYDMPEFKKVHEQLSQTQYLGISTLSSIYTEVYDFDRDVDYCIYLVDAAPEDDACPPGVVEHVEGADWDSARASGGQDAYITNTEMYGWLVTASTPVYDSNGEQAGLVAVDLDMNEIKANEEAFIYALAVTLILITAVISIITLFVVDMTVIRPLNKLSDVAVGYIVDNENRETFASININRDDEIGNLSDAMKKMENDIDNYIEDITTMTAEKERVSAELGVAAKMQSDMLPKDFPKRNDFEIYATMSPAKEMGGDFYDFFMIDDDHVGLIIADVSGKGVPAAMFMIVAKTLMKIHATSEKNAKPSKLMVDVNNTLCADNPSSLFVTAWFGVLTISTGELISSNAGHEYPALCRKDGSYELIKCDNMPPLATVEDIGYIDETIRLKPGDKLFLYTDGVPDAKSSDGTRFGTDKMIEILNRDRSLSPEETLKALKSDIDEFTGNLDPFDDITMLGFKYKGV